MKLDDYIDTHFKGVKAEFARAAGVQPQQVTQWLQKGFIVVNGALYSPRGPLPDCGAEKKFLPLNDYIEHHYQGVQANFARAARVKPQQVTQWLQKGFIVGNDVLYSHRRALPDADNNDHPGCE